MEAKHSLSACGDSGRSYREALLPRWRRGAASTSLIAPYLKTQPNICSVVLLSLGVCTEKPGISSGDCFYYFLYMKRIVFKDNEYFFFICLNTVVVVYAPRAGSVVFPWCPTESFGLLPQAGVGSCDHCYFFMHVKAGR